LSYIIKGLTYLLTYLSRY